jgi:hypothetical protein
MFEGARGSILVVAVWHLSLNLGSATEAGQGAASVVVTMFVVVWSIVVARAWRRRDPDAQSTQAQSCAAPGQGRAA